MGWNGVEWSEFRWNSTRRSSVEEECLRGWGWAGQLMAKAQQNNFPFPWFGLLSPAISGSCSLGNMLVPCWWVRCWLMKSSWEVRHQCKYSPRLFLNRAGAGESGDGAINHLITAQREMRRRRWMGALIKWKWFMFSSPLHREAWGWCSPSSTLYRNPAGSTPTVATLIVYIKLSCFNLLNVKTTVLKPVVYNLMVFESLNIQMHYIGTFHFADLMHPLYRNHCNRTISI